MSWSERFGSRLAKQRGSVGDATAGRAGSGLASAVNGVRPLRSRMLDYDHSLLWVVIALLGLGIVMVYSASIAMPNPSSTFPATATRTRRTRAAPSKGCASIWL